MKRCGVTRGETSERVESGKITDRDKEGHRQTDRQERSCRDFKVCTTAMQSPTDGTLRGQLFMVHFLHIKEPIKQHLVSCQHSALLSACASLSQSLSVFLIQETFENHTATMCCRGAQHPSEGLKKLSKN